MKRMLMTALATAALAGLLALTGGAASADASGSLVRSLAAGQCAAEKQDIGKKAFRKKYGKKGMPACIKKGRAAARQAVSVATQDCQAELEEFGLESFLEDWTSFEECVGDYAEWELDPVGDDGEEDEQELI